MSKDGDKIFEAFKNACRLLPDNVIPIYNTEKDAREIYKLKTTKQLIEFIANGGLEDVVYRDKKPWRNNFTKTKPLFTYAYLFRTGNIPGYISIIHHDKEGKWFIKSFHPPNNQSEKVLETLEGKMKSLGFKCSEDSYE